MRIVLACFLILAFFASQCAAQSYRDEFQKDREIRALEDIGRSLDSMRSDQRSREFREETRRNSEESAAYERQMMAMSLVQLQQEVLRLHRVVQQQNYLINKQTAQNKDLVADLSKQNAASRRAIADAEKRVQDGKRFEEVFNSLLARVKDGDAIWIEFFLEEASRRVGKPKDFTISAKDVEAKQP